MTRQDASAPARRVGHLLGGTMIVLAVLFALDVPRHLGLGLYTEQYLAAVLGLALAITYLISPRFHGRLAPLDPLLALTGLLSAGYVAVFYPSLVNELVYKPLDGLIVALTLGLLTVEAVRRLTGFGLTMIVVAFVLYGLFGHLLPVGMSRQIQWDRLAIYVVMDTNGLLGLPLMVTSVVVMGFVLMGQLLTRSGGGEFFNDLALALVGKSRGGAAKIAVVSSFLFGSVSGSAVANVAASGVVTLPLMKRAGYKPHLAAAIEALASTGGQLAPPIMGAAAFLMAEFLQIPYGTVVMAAIIPSALFYMAIFFYVDSHAAATGMRLPDDIQIRPLGRVLLDGWQFIAPFAVLLVGLFVLNWRPEFSALAAAALLAVLAVILPYRGKRGRLSDLARAVPQAGVSMVEIVIISAAAGVVIGVLNLSGLSFSLTLALVNLAEGSLWLLLVMAALVSVVLGMGMPTVGVYVLLASLIGPALTQAGINPIAAHMFLLYFGMLSMITPPVALASFTAASMAGADWMKTGMQAVKIGWVAYLIPFVMVLEPGLVMQAESKTVVWQAGAAVLGVWFATGAIYGYLRKPLSLLRRGMLLLAALVVILPVSPGGAGQVADVVALLVAGAIVFLPRRSHQPLPDP